VLVLGGAFVISRYLAQDISVPPPAEQTPTRITPVSEPQPIRPPPPPVAEAPKPAIAAPAPAPNVEVLSPFDGDSRELDYAEKLLDSPREDVNALRSAANVFETCLSQDPKHARCRAGLQRAKERLQTRGEELVKKSAQQADQVRRMAIDKGAIRPSMELTRP